MNRIELMELVREYQIGQVSRRQFLVRSTAVLGSVVAANSLLAACTAAPNDNPPPVVETSQPTAAATEAKPTETAAADSGNSPEPMSGIVTYPGLADETLMGYWTHQGGNAPRPAVIVIQEWWGLNDHIKEVADRFAAEGYVALAPDLYHGVVTTEPDEARKQAMELGMRDAVGEIQQAINFLKEQAFVNGRFGIVGFFRQRPVAQILPQRHHFMGRHSRPRKPQASRRRSSAFSDHAMASRPAAMKPCMPH